MLSSLHKKWSQKSKRQQSGCSMIKWTTRHFSLPISLRNECFAFVFNTSRILHGKSWSSSKAMYKIDFFLNFFTDSVEGCTWFLDEIRIRTYLHWKCSTTGAWCLSFDCSMFNFLITLLFLTFHESKWQSGRKTRKSLKESLRHDDLHGTEDTAARFLGFRVPRLVPQVLQLSMMIRHEGVRLEDVVDFGEAGVIERQPRHGPLVHVRVDYVAARGVSRQEGRQHLHVAALQLDLDDAVNLVQSVFHRRWALAGSFLAVGRARRLLRLSLWHLVVAFSAGIVLMVTFWKIEKITRR